MITIFGKTWDIHVTDVLRTTLHENLRMIRDSVAYLKAHGKEVIYDAEHFFDGYKANPEYALATLEAACRRGAAVLVLCDTNGGALPWQVAEAVDDVRQSGWTVPPSPHLGHPRPQRLRDWRGQHPGGGAPGAVQVQGTINGYGERCGNANLISVIPNLQLKMGYECVPQESSATDRHQPLCHRTGQPQPGDHQPFVGQTAFAHKGGTHVNAVVKNVMSYQHIDPALVGNETRVLVSELSGKDNIAVKREEFGLNGLSRDEERAVLQQIKELENAGFAFESAEASVDLMLRRVRHGYLRPLS